MQNKDIELQEPEQNKYEIVSTEKKRPTQRKRRR
jgi:hypothetical protein